MARRLFLLWVAIISLALLVQATPGLADTYDLPSFFNDYTESFPEGSNGYRPGSPYSEFNGRYEWVGGYFWQIGADYQYDEYTEEYRILTPLTNGPQAADEYTEDNIFYTFVYTYNDTLEPGKERFSATIPLEGGTSYSIISYDATITITAEYLDNGVEWSFQEDKGSMVGSGTNDIDGSTFSFIAELVVDSGNHTKTGHFENFVLTYAPSAVPIPGSVWLLSTGILGIWCLGRRRKE